MSCDQSCWSSFLTTAICVFCLLFLLVWPKRYKLYCFSKNRLLALLTFFIAFLIPVSLISVLLSSPSAFFRFILVFFVQKEKGTTEDEMAGWHHWLDGRESGWTSGIGDGQGGLACCDSWGRKESDMTERLNWTKLHCGLTANFVWFFF